MFAAPFVGQLGNGHVDGVYSMAKDPGALDRLASGSGDGVVKVWDMPTREEVWSSSAHENVVKGMCWTPERKLLTCAADKTVKLFDPYNTPTGAAPVATYLGSGAFTSVSHHRELPAFAAASSAISIYDLSRPSSAPSQTLNWPTSIDTITSVSFNQVETSILGSTANDRSVVIYDLRTGSPLHKVVLKLSSNALAWNPMEAFNFAVANEDHNIYIFDMRKMERALNVLKDHVAAVMDVEFSPTGEELVSASYDRTLRLWKRDQGHSRDIYHTKRMQRYALPLLYHSSIVKLTFSPESSPPNSPPTATSFSPVPTTAISASGGPTPHLVSASNPLANARNSNMTPRSLVDTVICRRSDVSRDIGTCLRRLRRLGRSRRMRSRVSRGRKRM